MPTTHSAMADKPSGRATVVLAVVSKTRDQRVLAQIFDHSNWLLHEAEDARSAIEILRTQTIPVVLFDCESGGGCWKELLRDLTSLPKPPLLIIASNGADASLWADALSLGVYDVLMKPFDKSEIFQVLGMAWRRWTYAGGTSNSSA